ncbi:hypothetical protein MKW94_018639 [Papaver nudicaule]|uniref:Uncharacterized protein n=1 Tax=Papaver nudicaule TaxID=74823 RepID=A0AA42AYN2_PAPNU|nr:hypothetical protein [Papaver nudicaule]
MKIPSADDLVHTITTNNIVDKQKILDFIEQVTTDAEQVQQSVLSEILSRNALVDYLQRHGLDGRTDRETFKKMLPVITYEDLKPDIDRIIANGINNTTSNNILCEQPISMFFGSSGTSSGVRKRIPTTEEDVKRRWFFGCLASVPIVEECIPGLDKGKIMSVMTTQPQKKTTGGILLSSATTCHYRSSCFVKGFKNNPYSNYTSPIDAIHCEDTYQSTYSQLLYGLYENNQVLRIGAAFGSGVVQTIRFLQENWTLICNDIRTGTTKITSPLAQKAVMELLNNKPNPELANFIETECKKTSSWKGIIARLWPNAKYISAIVTGTMSQYIPTIDFYSNGLPIVCPMYVGSECGMGINLNPLSKPDQVSYTLIPTMAYFEFLPVHDDNNNHNSPPNRVHELVDLTAVKLGQEYEIVVTTYTGLYRYRVGDVLRVAGFKNNAPQFNFIRRNNALLSIDTEKTDEVELQNAVKTAENYLTKSINASIVDYTSFAHYSSVTPGHYVLYFELQYRDKISCAASVFEECCLQMEESLSTEYRDLRVYKKSIGPLEIKIVETGTFDELMDYAISQGSSASQYKTPRSVKLSPIVQLLNSRVVSNYFSLKCPRPGVIHL